MMYYMRGPIQARFGHDISEFGLWGLVWGLGLIGRPTGSIIIKALIILIVWISLKLVEENDDVFSCDDYKTTSYGDPPK